MPRPITLAHINSLNSHRLHPLETITVTGSPPGGGSPPTDPPGSGGGGSGGIGGPGNSIAFSSDKAINLYDNYYYNGNANDKGGDLGSAGHNNNVFGGLAATNTEVQALSVAAGTPAEEQISVKADAGDWGGASGVIQSYANSDLAIYASHTNGGNALKGFTKLVGIVGGEVGGFAGVVAGATQIIRGNFVTGFKDLGGGLAAMSVATHIAESDPDVAVALQEIANSINYVVVNYANANKTGGYSPGAKSSTYQIDTNNHRSVPFTYSSSVQSFGEHESGFTSHSVLAHLT